MPYVYAHIRLDTNQPFYIGVGADNYGKHKRAYQVENRTRYWKNISIKAKHKVVILLDNLSYEEALLKEKYFISLYGRKDLNKGTLCNLTDGGVGACNKVFSAATKQKISVAHKGRKHTPQASLNIKLAQRNRVYSEQYRKNISDRRIGVKASVEVREKIRKANIGKKHTQETKLLISVSKLGKKRTEEQKIKMSNIWQNRSEENKKQISLRLSNNHRLSKIVLCKETGIFYNSITEASKIYNFSDVHLSMMLHGKCKNKTNLILS